MSERVIDVRLNNKASNGEVNIRDEIIKGLSRPLNQKTLPQLLLYDEDGLHIFDEITTQASEYYVFSAEEALIKRHAHDIVQVMQGRHEDMDQHLIGGVILELGAGYVHRSQALYSPIFLRTMKAFHTLRVFLCPPAWPPFSWLCWRGVCLIVLLLWCVLNHRGAGCPFRWK